MHALLIAVEDYHHTKEFPKVDFALKDLAELKGCLVDIGMPIENIQSIENERATRTAILEAAKRVARFAKKDEYIYFYFAGHGLFSNGQNLLAAVDTIASSIESSAVSLTELLGVFEGSESKKVVLFLDCCHSGLHYEKVRGATGQFSTESLRYQYSNSEFLIGFASCKGDEKSWPDSALTHGIWTHYLITALRGNAANIYEEGLLMSDKLQNYLRDETSRHVQLKRVSKDTQTPIKFGKETDRFIVANLAEVFSRRQLEAATADLPAPRRIRISAEKSGPVKDLPGFRSTHRLPYEFSDYATNFIQKVGADLLVDELDKVAEKLRVHLGYKRKDMTRPERVGGTASLVTRDFDFVIQIGQDKERPSWYSIRYTIENFRNPAMLLDDRFNEVFSAEFNELEFIAEKKIDVDALIDRVEALESESVTVEYRHSDTSECKIRIKGLPYTVAVNRYGLTVVSFTKQSPLQLASGFRELNKEIQGTVLLKLTD